VPFVSESNGFTHDVRESWEISRSITAYVCSNKAPAEASGVFWNENPSMRWTSWRWLLGTTVPALILGVASCGGAGGPTLSAGGARLRRRPGPPRAAGGVLDPPRSRIGPYNGKPQSYY
jgi:hypothetical protein